MASTTGKRIKEAISMLESHGLHQYSEALNDAYLYSSSSSEIYFKASGILNTLLSNGDFDNELTRIFLSNLKKDIDKNIK